MQFLSVGPVICRTAVNARFNPSTLGRCGRPIASSRRCLSVSDRSPVSEMRQEIAAGAQDPFYIVNLNKVVNKVRQWNHHLPRVQPYYAVKCNPDEQVVSLLAALGVSFDCASRGEIELVRSLGVSAQRIIYANPCKQLSHLVHAQSVGVPLSVFDAREELDKLQAHSPETDLLVRISVDDSGAVCQLSCKYGTDPSPVSMKFLLQHAANLGLNVRGVSFHVGSGCSNPAAFDEAIASARCVFDTAAELGVVMDTLDIGGGFPGVDTETLSFPMIADRINEALDVYFPPSSDTRVIAEPGRFFVASSHCLAVNIIGRKSKPPRSDQDSAEFMYFINDGVYGSFNCMLYDHQEVQWNILPHGIPINTNSDHISSIWGPTCDGLDCISAKTTMPQLQVGQWLYFDKMGAYTAAAGSNFNGMDLPGKVYIPADVSNSISDSVHAPSKDSVMCQDWGYANTSSHTHEATPHKHMRQHHTCTHVTQHHTHT